MRVILESLVVTVSFMYMPLYAMDAMDAKPDAETKTAIEVHIEDIAKKEKLLALLDRDVVEKEVEIKRVRAEADSLCGDDALKARGKLDLEIKTVENLYAERTHLSNELSKKLEEFKVLIGTLPAVREYRSQKTSKS